MEFQRHSRIRGRRNPNARLTEELVRTIKQRYEAGDTQGHLARVYQVSINTIGRIVRGETWNWLEGEEAPGQGIEPKLPDIPVPPPNLARLLAGTEAAAAAATTSNNEEKKDGSEQPQPVRRNKYY